MDDAGFLKIRTNGRDPPWLYGATAVGGGAQSDQDSLKLGLPKAVGNWSKALILADVRDGQEIPDAFPRGGEILGI